MENTPLHAQKVTILSRLIKESSLTLEEALVLLKEEEEAQEAPVLTPGTTTPWTTSPYIQPYRGSGIITTSGSSTTTVPVAANITYTSGITDLNN